MRRKFPLSVSATSLVIASVSCTVALFVALRLIEIFPWKNITAIDVIIACSLGIGVTSTFFTAFHRGLFLRTLNPVNDPRSLISEAALTQLMILLLFGLQKLNASATFISLLSLQLLTSWNTFKLAAPTLKVPERTSNMLPWVAVGLVGLYGFVIWPTRNFWRVDALIGSIAVWQAAVHALLVAGVTTWFTVVPKYRLSGGDFLATLHLRIANDGKIMTPWTLTLLSAGLNLTGAMIIWSLIKTEEHNYPLSTIAAAQFLYLPAFIDAWERMNRAGQDQIQLRTLSRFTPRGTRKLFDRYSSKKSEWAATVGIRTSIFTIDHDPMLLLSGKMPASFMAIRNDEIATILNRLIGDRHMASTTIANRVVGVIDPELSVRPCVDALNIFATLYLDAGTLIERRMKSLAELLPIVNPGLAKFVSSKSVGELLSQNQWFFHFDFNWVDQSIVNTESMSRHGVMLEPISDSSRTMLLTQMKKTNGIGNFLWIGKEAHDRLLQEAPSLTSIMEPHQIRVEGERDLLLFAIKFEQLVPRLQRYYGLDQLRQKVIDYDATPEAQRLLKIMGIQIENARNSGELHRYIESLASYRWHGFKEKDLALRLLIKIHELHSRDSGDQPNLIAVLQSAASKIGYPSQVMTQAQLKKLALRDIKNLRDHALNPSDPRFHESWSLLASLDYNKIPAPEASAIYKLIDEASCKKDILITGVTGARMIDATIGLIRRGGASDLKANINLLSDVIRRIGQNNADPEILTLALDAMTFCGDQHKGNVSFASALSEVFETLVHSREAEQNLWAQSLRNRWQEYKSRASAHQATARDDIAS